ncbi:MAG: OadG family transporter subunit [Dehalococcoidia bacterium]
MYSDGLEIAGIGVGMVFLALVAILILIVGLRWAIEYGEGIRRKRASPPEAAPDAPEEAAARERQLKAEKAAAIAVALYMAEETDIDT